MRSPIFTAIFCVALLYLLCIIEVAHAEVITNIKQIDVNKILVGTSKNTGNITKSGNRGKATVTTIYTEESVKRDNARKEELKNGR